MEVKKHIEILQQRKKDIMDIINFQATYKKQIIIEKISNGPQ